MKRMFNHTKRPENQDISREEWENYEEEYYAEEEGEYYAEEEGEYYAEEEGEYYAEEEGEYYAEEEGEYYAEEEGEYYAEEEGEYYAEEEGEYYAEEEGEYYAGEEGEYYAEEEGEYYAAEEEGEAPNAEEGEIIYEDDDLYNADYRGERTGGDNGRNARTGLIGKLMSMSVMDRVIAGTGTAVLILALVTAIVLMNSKTVQDQVSDFISVGTQLEDIDLIGREGLLAVADAQMARLEAASMIWDEEEPSVDEEDSGYEENEYSRQVTVEMSFTSIQKDLKIKFTNQKTGKLVANVPFSVTVTDPDGKTSIWSDDDMDGIIYKKDIAPGTYKVAMEELSDERYAGYSVSTMVRSAEVKKDIAYEKVDVANEVKTEAEVDVAKEDTAQKETVVESALQDTVAWVESTKVGESYIEISKSDIADPLTILKVTKGLDKSFMRMTLQSASVSITSAPGSEIKVGGTTQLTAGTINTTDITGDAGEKITGVTLMSSEWTSSDSAIAAVDDNGLVKGVAKGEATIRYTAKVNVTYEVTSSPAGSDVSGGDSAGGTSSDTQTETKTEEKEVSGQITVKVVEDSALTKGTLTADKPALTTVIKKTVNAQVTAEGFEEGKKLVYKVSSDKETVATATVDAAGKVTVTGVGAGTANITVTADYEEGGTGETAAKTVIAVTVGANKTIELESTETLAYVANPLILDVTVKGATATDLQMTVESSDTTVMKATMGTLKTENNVITVPVTLELFKEGSATLFVKCSENDEQVEATCVVTVKANPKEDKNTPLKDKSDRTLYVYDNEKKEYRPAKYADYYNSDKFYVMGDVKYTGWQTLEGHVYYFTAEGKKVTGEQVIQGAKYNFASDGALVTGNGTMGIDVSKWNGTIDWNAVKNSGISYVIIRCGYRGSSEGALIEDPKFQANIKGAIKADLKVGVYFFTQAIDEREAVEEASMVLGLIKNYKISYPVFLDVESSGGRADSISKETRTAVCKAFCQTIQNAGYTAGIYANKTWLEKKMDASALNAYKIWLAQYAQTPTYTGRYDLWQYRSTGKVSGISGNVDMNLSYLGY